MKDDPQDLRRQLKEAHMSRGLVYAAIHDELYHRTLGGGWPDTEPNVFDREGTVTVSDHPSEAFPHEEDGHSHAGQRGEQHGQDHR